MTGHWVSRAFPRNSPPAVSRAGLQPPVLGGPTHMALGQLWDCLALPALPPQLVNGLRNWKKS